MIQMTPLKWLILGILGFSVGWLIGGWCHRKDEVIG